MAAVSGSSLSACQARALGIAVFGLKQRMGLDRFAGRVPWLGRRRIRSPCARGFAVSLEKGVRGDLACPRCSWLVTCSACVLAATLTAQTELQQSLPDVCAGALSMQKHLVLERVPLHAELLMYFLLLIDLQKWRKKKQPRFENKTSVVDL